MFWEPLLEEKRLLGKKAYAARKAKEKSKTFVEPDVKRSKKTFHVKDLNVVVPKTETQRLVCKSYKSNPELNHLLVGSAGTGKTFLGMGLGLEDVLDSATPYEKLLIVRSVVPTRDMGFLPGDVLEKMAVYESPYISACDDLFDVRESYNNLKELGLIEFITTSFLRGQTFNDCIILVDEFENMTFQELSTIITRAGYNSKIIFSGDFRQSDLLGKRNETSGFYPFVDIIKSMKTQFGIFEFGHQDIIRSGLCKEWIIKSEEFFDKESSQHE
jgi:predicted ribonuclease YlaK